jgi:hypothetical protein
MQENEEEMRHNQKVKLVLAMAQGESASAWARQNGVPARTARRWAKDPNVRAGIQAWRRRALSRAVGRLASLALKAADGIANLAQGAESESVQLRAWRAILTDQMAIAKFSDLEQRMLEIEERLRGPTGHTDHAGEVRGSARPERYQSST